MLFVWTGVLLTARLSPQQGLAPADTLMLRGGGACRVALLGEPLGVAVVTAGMVIGVAASR